MQKKKAKRNTKQVQLKVRTNVKSGLLLERGGPESQIFLESPKYLTLT